MSEQRKRISVQLFRYALVGGMAFLVDFGTLYVLTEYLHLYYILSASVAFCLGLTCNYLLSVRWVFDERALSNKYAEFLVFSLIGLVGLVFNAGLIWFLTEVGGLYYLLSKVITTVIIFFWNFFARRQLLFISRARASERKSA